MKDDSYHSKDLTLAPVLKFQLKGRPTLGLARVVDPGDDLEGGADYERDLIGVFLKRAFNKALS